MGRRESAPRASSEALRPKRAAFFVGRRGGTIFELEFFYFFSIYQTYMWLYFFKKNVTLPLVGLAVRSYRRMNRR
jgi:hypothetical protein